MPENSVIRLKMSDERNFRSSYYEKVGCRGVEEKKSLEILMKEKPWDKVKLKQFCLRFTVPAAYRNLVWKVLLDILPVYPDSHAYVTQQRTEQYQDLLYAAETLELADMSGPRSQILLQMWLLENEQTRPPVFPETNCCSSDTFVPIAETLSELYSDEVDVYWLCKGLTNVVRQMQKDLARLKEAFQSMLEKEDGELFNYGASVACGDSELYSDEVDVYWLCKGRASSVIRSLVQQQPCHSCVEETLVIQLVTHLADIYALDALPLTKWFNCCFAGVLDDTSLAKIWDKVCSGAPKILSFVAVMLVITLRRNILKAKNSEEVLNCVSEIPEQCEEVVANKAIELWQYYGAQPQSDQLAKK